MIRLMVKANFIIVIKSNIMTDNGKMENEMDMGPMWIKMEIYLKDYGKII